MSRFRGTSVRGLRLRGGCRTNSRSGIVGIHRNEFTEEGRCALAERFGGRLVNIDIDVEELAERIDGHLSALTRKVRRASREGVGRRCRDAAGRYLSEADVLVGKARNVKRVGKQWRDTGPVKPFDRDNFRRGLTPAGRRGCRANGVRRRPDVGNPIDVHNRILLARSY